MFIKKKEKNIEDLNKDESNLYSVKLSCFLNYSLLLQ